MLLTLAIIGALLLVAGIALPAGTYGRQVLEDTGSIIEVIADGRRDGAKVGGVVVDWSVVAAVSADTTLDDGTIVKNGDKYLQYGTIVDLIGTSEVQTVDLSPGADPTGGTWTISYGGATSAAIAWNATAQAVLNAMEDMSTIEPGDVTVTGPVAFVYTLTFNPRLGNVAAVTASGANLLTAQAITITTTTAGAGTGKYGPADTTATDGRQTLARGESFFINRTVVYSVTGSEIVAGYEAGTVWQHRLGVAENGFTNAPTLASVMTAFPMLRVIKENA